MTSQIETNELSKNARGGTELMMERLYQYVDKDLLENFQIIPSRVRQLKEDKLRIFYCHDLPLDPESEVLANQGWNKFHKIVFVSHWQQQMYCNHFNIPPSRTTVLLNAINPISVDFSTKFKDIKDQTINVLYHSTPHRGLHILVPTIDALVKTHPNIMLHVFSSFNLYGWPERDKQFKGIFDKIKKHPNMKYYGSVPNEEIVDHIKDMHVFAYPSIWPETSCLALMESMAGGLCCVHPTLAALPETASNLTFMYDFNENEEKHALVFADLLNKTLFALREDTEQMVQRVKYQSQYANIFYNWQIRKHQWERVLNEVLNDPLPTTIESGMFVYKPF